MIRKALDEKQIKEFLLANPEFLVNNPGVLNSLEIVHDSGVAVSLIQKQVENLRANYNLTTNHFLNLIEIAKGNENIFLETKRLILSLIETSNLKELILTTEKSFVTTFKATRSKLIFYSDSNASFPIGRLKTPEETSAILGKILNSDKTYRGPIESEVSNFIFDKKSKIIEAVLVPLSSSSIKGLLALGSDIRGKYHDEKDTLFLDFLVEVISKLIDKYND